MIEPSHKLLAGVGTGHELGGRTNTDLVVVTGVLVARTRHGVVVGTRHKNMVGLLTVKIYIVIILILIRIHIPTMGLMASAGPTMSYCPPHYRQRWLGI